MYAIRSYYVVLLVLDRLIPGLGIAAHASDIVGQVEFDVPTATYSDAHTRMTLKYREMYQTIRIIRQVLDMMSYNFV